MRSKNPFVFPASRRDDIKEKYMVKTMSKLVYNKPVSFSVLAAWDVLIKTRRHYLTITRIKH
jgi:hypothetical protein